MRRAPPPAPVLRSLPDATLRRARARAAEGAIEPLDTRTWEPQDGEPDPWSAPDLRPALRSARR